jgi:fructose-bisphosphate aldolase, class II
MPLISLLGELKRAQAQKYALPCFDTFEMFGSEGMLTALDEKRAPAYVALWSGFLDQKSSASFVAFLRNMAGEAVVPISLILDHGDSYDHCIKALSLGFTDVMYDGSQFPLEENIANTRRVVLAAHNVGAAAEAELGHVGSGNDYDAFGAQRKGFTDPATVERFVAETGVDALAVAIGTAHGVYKGEPQLDLQLLQEIRRRVDIPLVLHGGTGLSEVQFRSAIAAGISKINIFTDLALAATARMVNAAKAEGASYFNIAGAARDAFHERCGYFADLFGATGKASR